MKLLPIMLLLMLVFSNSLGSSNIPEEVTVMARAMQLDGILDVERINRESIKTAMHLDTRHGDVSLNSVDILDSYFYDKRSVKNVFKKLTRKERTKLLKQIIIDLSELHNIDPKLVLAVAKKESHFNPNAKSHAGAVGVMQLMKPTAIILGVEDRYNPVENIEGGILYLKYLQKMYKGKTKLVLAAYNAGPGAVDKYKGIPPYEETVHYVKTVISYTKRF